ncbi:ankyrin repeat domain-containing protein 17-like [Physella acuta]|uniref:ankyrin repeat domain-containing protein 17-like n=1 Tax=Physella acuta TaxID=109671 RepID=UPI0027DD6B1C|nr:ankyrin repeat domain-containing protein 17-like [Physella acuta]XP_059173981.1 ankyrin repeat domain-containing protein 17-like [Physella acuta]
MASNEDAFLLAIKSGRENRVRELLNANLKTNLISRTALNNGLIQATNMNKIECVRICIEYKADVNHRDVTGMTAAMYAADKGYFNCLQILCEAGANMSCTDTYGTNALMLSAQWGNSSECFQYLINKTLQDLNKRDNTGNTALHYACKHDYGEGVKRLVDLNYAVDLNAVESEMGYSPLMHAIKRGFYALARILLNKNVDLNIVGNDEKTALTLALEQSIKDYDLIEQILTSSSNLEIKNDSVFLHIMVAQNKNKIVRRMLINNVLPIDRQCVEQSYFPFDFYSSEISPLCVALLSEYKDIALYFICNRFFSSYDMHHLLNDKGLKLKLEAMENSKELLDILKYLSDRPEILTEKVEGSQLKHLCINSWHNIPLSPDYEIEPCGCSDCLDGGYKIKE